MAVGDGTPCDIVYDYVEKGYRMEGGQVQKLSNSEILALCKILLDSRAFVKTEMEEMLRKVISCCVPASNQAMVTRLVNNEPSTTSNRGTGRVSSTLCGISARPFSSTVMSMCLMAG